MSRKTYLIAWLGALTVVISACRSPWEVIPPVIHAKPEDKAAAMISAPVIIIAEVQDAKLYNRPREVEKPPEVGGPMMPRIPLDLAKVSANVLLTLRGPETTHVQFYSWIWASGSHGGPRIFSPSPGLVRILFLEEKAGYLHTVGDYLSYDLMIRARSVPTFLSEWNAGYARGGTLVERIVGVLLKAELENVPADGSNSFLNTWDLGELASFSYIKGQFELLCNHLRNSTGRAKACAELADATREESYRPR